MKELNELCKEAHETAKEKGFYDPPLPVPVIIAKMHRELSEMFEADRRGEYCEEKIIDGVISLVHDNHFSEAFEARLKGKFEQELTDVVIHAFDLAGHLGIDLDSHFRAGMRYNKLRKNKHGKRY